MLDSLYFCRFIDLKVRASHNSIYHLVTARFNEWIKGQRDIPSIIFARSHIILFYLDAWSGKDDRCEGVGCSFLAVETASYKMLDVMVR